MSARMLCVILHYGSQADTWSCARSVAGDDSVDIVVADNDPAQDLQMPADLYARVRLYRTGGGASFAAANNRAVAQTRRPEHALLLLLNNDTLAEAGALAALRAAAADARIGAAGPCMPYASDPARVWACGGVIDRERVAIYGIESRRGTEPYEVDYLPGAAILCPLTAWDIAGGLPERYFLGFEEAEFALRLRAAGLRVVAVPRASVLHSVGMSSDKQPMYLYNDVRSRLRFGACLFGRTAGYARAALRTLLEMRHRRLGLRLWARALADELRGRPLDRKALLAVRERFPA